MKNKLYILVIFIIFIFYFILNYKENFSDYEKKLMTDNVKKYPTTFSVDPFFTSTFKPECCPNTYSTSSGCLCLDKDIYSILYSRGGNNYGFRYAS